MKLELDRIKDYARMQLRWAQAQVSFYENFVELLRWMKLNYDSN